jgi:hypothetical protein
MLVSVQDDGLFPNLRLGISFYTLSFDVSETSSIIPEISENREAARPTRRHERFYHMKKT